MSATVRVLVVPATSAPTVQDIPRPNYDAVRDLLNGGWLEGIGDGDTWTAYLDEEGKIKGLPFNAPATVLAADLGWAGLPGDILVGPVVFLGPTDDEGDDTDVTDAVLGAARARGFPV